MDTLTVVANNELMQSAAVIVQGIFLILGALISLFSKGKK